MTTVKLSDEQWERIRHHFPEEAQKGKRLGRPPVPARRVFEAVLWILHTGAQWSFLPQHYPNYKTVHRRFQTWVRTGVLERVLRDLAGEARQRGLFDGTEACVDASFARAKGGGAGVGNTKAGKGVNRTYLKKPRWLKKMQMADSWTNARKFSG